MPSAEGKCWCWGLGLDLTGTVGVPYAHPSILTASGDTSVGQARHRFYRACVRAEVDRRTGPIRMP